MIFEDRYPTGTSWGDWARHVSNDPASFDGRDSSRKLADAILAALPSANTHGVTDPAAIRAEAVTADDDLIADAERWRAFISSERFYVMGWAGFTGDMEYPEVKPDHDPRDWLHFTLNVWDKHPAGDDQQGRHGRALLMAYVEHLRALLTPQGREAV